MECQTELRPRNYAARIAKLETLEERRAALEQVPEQWRDIVKTHLKIAFERKRFERDQGHRD